MFEKLDAYLEDVGHFLSGREEREEILAEIRSYLLEKAERESGEVSAAALDKVMAEYGPPRRVAEKYLDGTPIISPLFKRHLFRYTSILFSIHVLLTVIAVLFKKSFLLFPLIFIPRLGPIEAAAYLGSAFLADLGAVALILHLITRSRKEIKLPWPKFGEDLDEAKPRKRMIGNVFGLVITLAVTDAALYLYVKYHTLFFANLDFPAPEPLFLPVPGKRISLIVIALLAVSMLTQFIKFFTRSRWVDAASNAAVLVLLGFLFRLPSGRLFAEPGPGRLFSLFETGMTLTLVLMAVIVTVLLIRNLILAGRKHFRK